MRTFLTVLLMAMAPALSAAPTRDARESLTQLETRTAHLAQSVAELETLLVKVNSVQTQLGELQAALRDHRVLLEQSPAVASRTPRWLRDALIFLLGTAASLLLLFGYQLLRGYDEGELPAEAYTPGMMSTAPPSVQEPAGSTDPSPRSEGTS